MSKASEIAKGLFQYMKERVLPEIADEVVHSVSRGCSELAAALFTEQGFVMYGPHRGLATKLDKHDHQPQAEQKQDLNQEIEHEL